MRNRWTVFGGTAVLVAASLAAGGGTEPGNEIFQQLTREGVAVGAGRRSKLPAPSMADGLDARAQRAVLESVAGSDYTVDELVRDSVVAPFVLKFRDAGAADPEAPAYGIDLWFVAHGDFKALTDCSGLALRDGGRKQARAHVLTEQELTRRKLQERCGPGRHERYGHAVLNVFDRLQLNLTLHALTTRHPECLLSAARVDSRFNEDADFPNQWRRLECDDDGRPVPGPAHPYNDGGAFLKVTKLLEPAGGNFVEVHAVLMEPKGWFGGANLLRSKVPLVARSEIRNFRRELAKNPAGR
jgi:hypothetical protein